MSFPIIISTDSVPSGFCPISDTDWAFLVSLLHGSISGDPTFNIGNSTPDPDQRGTPWLRYNSDGTPDRIYSFVNGIWQSPHLTPTGIVTLYRGDAALIDALDGGSAGAVTTISGPFWARVTEIDGRFPMSPGTLPSGLVVPVTGTGGVETLTLTAGQGPLHKHLIANIDENTDASGAPTLSPTNTLEMQYFTGAGVGYSLKGSLTEATLGNTSESGGTDPVNVLNRYYGIYYLERTLRRFYTQPA